MLMLASAEIEASVDPMENSRQLCTVLVKYLQRFIATDEDHDSKSPPTSSPPYMSDQPVHGLILNFVISLKFSSHVAMVILSL